MSSHFFCSEVVKLVELVVYNNKNETAKVPSTMALLLLLRRAAKVECASVNTNRRRCIEVDLEEKQQSPRLISSKDCVMFSMIENNSLK